MGRKGLFSTTFYATFIALLCVAAILGLTLPLAAGPAAQDATPSPVATAAPVGTPLPGVPVRLGANTLFYVFERLGPLSAADRAALISKKLEQLAEDPFAPPLEVTLAESELGIDVIVGEIVLMTITYADAGAMNMLPAQAAQKATQIIQERVNNYRQLNTPQARGLRILAAVALAVVLLVILFFLNRQFQRGLERYEQQNVAGNAQDALATSGIYRTGLWRRLIHLLFDLVRIVALLVLLFAVVPILFRLVPLTAGFGEQLSVYVNNFFSGVWNWFGDNRGNLFAIVIIVVITHGLARLVRAFFQEVEQGTIRINGFDSDWAPFTSQIIGFLLYIGAVIVAFPYIPGSDTEAFRGVSIFLGALLTFSSTAAVTNIVAGVIQTYTGAFRVGDVVRISETTGVVTEKRLLTTRIRTPKQEEVSIPNAVVMNASVVNYSTLAHNKGLILYTTVTIGYDVPWRSVHALLLSAAAKTTELLTDPPPFVLQTSLNDYHISYQLNCFTNHPEVMQRTYSQLHQNIQEAFNEAGVEIMSPAFTALRDGNTVTLPPDSRPSGYQAPGFRIDLGK